MPHIVARCGCANNHIPELDTRLGPSRCCCACQAKCCSPPHLHLYLMSLLGLLQVVKSDSATVTIPELEFEIPAATQKGTITTLEGLLSDAADNLRALQEQRHQQQPETAAAIDAFLSKLDSCTASRRAFTFVVDDPAGNSYLESPDGDVQADAALKVRYYERSREQAEAVGLSVPDAEQEGASSSQVSC